MIAAPPLQRGYLRSPGEGLVRLPQSDDSVTPLSFAGLVGWWKADSYALPDNTSVFGAGKRWVDQTGSGNDLTDGGVAAFQPVFRTNQVNGLPALVADGNNRFGTMPTNIVLGNTNWTVIAVASGMTAATQAIAGRSPGDSRFQHRASPNGLYLPFEAGSTSSDAFSAAIGATQMMTFMARGAVYKFFEGKTERTNVTPLPATVAVTLNNVMHDGSSFPTFNGKMCEFLVYAGALTNVNIANLYDGYFKPRWAVA